MVIAPMVLWLAKALWERFRLHRDAVAIEQWLWTHTRRAGGVSSDCLRDCPPSGLSVARVNRAVAHNRAIVRSDGHSDQVSVWRQEPQSVYDNRGLVDILLR